jgi:hypothetical protein
MSQDSQPSGSAIPSTKPKGSEKQSITSPNMTPLNPWIVIKLKYYEYVLPATFLPMIMEMFQNMEYLDDDKISPIGRKIGVSFLSDHEYKVYKANWELTKQVGD